MVEINSYEDPEALSHLVKARGHRELIGGLWDELGRLQLQFMVSRGLLPSMKLLDVGCGCLRGGVRFVGYLAPAHYFGIDASTELLDAGYDVELKAAGLSDRLPRTHLLCDAEFNVGTFGVTFDMAIAQSLFTHLPLNHIRLCLERVASVMRIGGRFFATAFVCPDGGAWSSPITHSPGGVVSYPAMDPYHYSVDDLRWCASRLPWKVEHIGNWNHPRGQEMFGFERVAEA